MTNLKLIADQLSNSGSMATMRNLRELFSEREYQTSNGVYRQALVFPNECVIKAPLYNTKTDRRRLYEEYEFISSMKESAWEKHFPETYFVENEFAVSLVQEYVPNVGGIPKAVWSSVPKSCDHNDIQDLVVSLGEYLCVDDIHEWNYGWKYDDVLKEYYPVFIDVDFRHMSKIHLPFSWVI